MKKNREMNAAVYREFGGQITIEKKDIPILCDENAVILQVKATGICRSDWHGWKGHDDDIKKFGVINGFIPGHEVAGTIHKAGEKVKKFKIGDRVAVPFILSCGRCCECVIGKHTVCMDQQQPGFTTNGSFAEFVMLPRADENLSILPDNVSFISAAALGCRFTTAYRAVVVKGCLSSEGSPLLVVFGCGGVGLSCIMIARATCPSATIIAVDTNPMALLHAKDVGATFTVDASNTSTEDLRAKLIDEFCFGRGADISIDAAGFKQTCENSVYCARRGGRVIQVGLPLEESPAIPMALVAGRELEIMGSHGCAAKDIPVILDMCSRGILRPERLIHSQVDLHTGAKLLMNMDEITNSNMIGIVMITQFQSSTD